MTLWAFAAATVPPLAVALIAGGLGAASIAPRLATNAIVPVSLFGILLFVAMMTFKRARGWNAAFLMAFSFVAFSVVSRLFQGRVGGTWLGAAATAGLIVAASAAVGRSIGKRLVRISPGLWLLSWIYLFGWAIIAVLALPPVAVRSWAIAGLIVYTGLSAAWFAGLDPSAPDPSGTAWAIDVYLLGFNLAIAARVAMWRGS